MRWYTLIHNIPPKPLYLRTKIRQRLDSVGAMPLKNSVYILPATPDTLEDFQWIAQEVTAGGGEAHILETNFVTGEAERETVARFQAARNNDYAQITKASDPARARRRFDEIRRIDFFDAPRRSAAEKALRLLEKNKKEDPMLAPHPELRGKTWVTRPGIKVDRMASAWFIRRYVDPKARFRFADPAAPKKNGELRFDMVGGDFTHEDDRCTLETLIRRVGVPDAGVKAVAEIVHDLDLKDEKYGRAEAAGVRVLIEGIVARHESDNDRLDRGLALFDDLHQALRQPRRKQPKK